MKTSVERVDDTTVKLTVTVEADRVGRAVDEAARHLAKDLRVPGFRPGKAPRRVLESRLGKGAILEHAAQDALPGFYSEAVRAEALDVVGRPDVSVQTFEDGQDAEFTATVEVRPEFDLPDLSGVQVAHPEWEVTDEEVDEQLDALRERFAELDTVQRPVQVGDYAVVTVSGSRDGQPVEEAGVEDALYEVSDPDESGVELDRQLLGARPGGILRFRDTLGADYGELAGQELDFTTIVKEVKAKRLPELDDDFAITASEFDTSDELRDAIRRQLLVEKRRLARAALRAKVVDVVGDMVDVPLPESMIREEVQFRMMRLAHEAEEHDISVEQFLSMAGVSAEEVSGQMEEEARKTVKAQLVVDQAGRDAGIEVTQEDLGSEIARQSVRLGRPPEELAEFMTQPERIGALVSDAFRRKAIDHLIDRVQVLSAPPEDDADLAELVPAAGGADEPSTGSER